MKKIILKGNALSTNNIYAMSRMGMYMKAEGKARKEEYAWSAKEQWRPRKIIKGDLGVIIGLYFGDKKRRDIDNYHKLSLDALTGIVWEDDSQIQWMSVHKYYDKKNPRIEIDVVE